MSDNHRQAVTALVSDADQISCGSVGFVNEDESNITVELRMNHTPEDRDRFLKALDHTMECVSQPLFKYSSKDEKWEKPSVIFLRNGDYLAYVYNQDISEHYWMYFRSVSIPEHLKL